MLRDLRASVVSVLIIAVLLGGLFPALVTVLAQVALPHQANGSLIVRDGRVVGSSLIAQGFNGDRYFHPRPSAAGGGYDATASGGTNLGPTSSKLVQDMTELAARYRRVNGLPANAPVPADVVTRSASGLDPDISPANAELQTARVAKARGMPEAAVRRLVAARLEPRQWGFLGEPRVNVLMLNLALDEAQGRSR